MPVPIRTITYHLERTHPLHERDLLRAATFLAEARAAAEAAGFEVQTVRVATRPVLADLAAWDERALTGYARELQRICDGLALAYLSIGPAPAYEPAFPLERLAVVPPMLGPHAALHASVQLATVEQGLRAGAALATARVMRDLAALGGAEANFRFAALAACEPGGPFFPQAYAAGAAPSVAVGLQSASLVREAVGAVTADAGGVLAAPGAVSAAIAEALATAGAAVLAVVGAVAARHGIEARIDLSPAPMGADSIAAAFELAGVSRFGAPGTLAVAAAITAGVRGTNLPMCGYCGLMLPVLEDAVLGQRCAEGLLGVHALLAYSSVCGTGLDTVPISGETPDSDIAALLTDVAALAVRLRKPLSARLFLVPRARAGEMTTFTSPYLTNTRILTLGE